MAKFEGYITKMASNVRGTRRKTKAHDTQCRLHDKNTNYTFKFEVYMPKTA